MIDLAINYAQELQAKFRETWFNDKYKYWNNSSYYREFTIDSDTWNRHQFVSVDCNGNVIGYISYDINRNANFCHTLNIINFTDDILIFALDLKRVLSDIFERFKFNKLDFTVVVGNPIEKSYDKAVKKYGGRVVGFFQNEVRLIDGDLCNVKLYEITREEYLNVAGR